jgi:hypothetical protein
MSHSPITREQKISAIQHINSQSTFRKSRDIYESLALELDGNIIEDVEPSGRAAVFVFRDTPELRESIRRYHARELYFELHEVFNSWKALKSRAFSATGDVR